MLEKNRMISKIIFIALVVFFITTVSHAQGIFGNSSSSSSQTNVEPSQNKGSSSNTNTTTNNTTNNTMIDSSMNTTNTNTTDNSSVMNIEMGDPNIPPPMGEPNQDMHNVDNSQITGQASPRWVRDIDWATCVQKRFNDGESFMASRGACN
jgi:high-affinity K+ transport system ATPase subunit B